jgi:hypothetical protein
MVVCVPYSVTATLPEKFGRVMLAGGPAFARSDDPDRQRE